MSLSQQELAHMAEHFFGYGRWDAPYWFVGPEAGMSKDGIDTLSARYSSWKQLGCAEVVDCKKHHLGFGFTKWHQEHPPTQPTWRQLIRLLLTYKGLPADTEAIREYQRTQWGSETGESGVIELSGLAAPNMSEQRDRATFLARRIERIRQKVREHHPVFVLMYGESHRAEWERIANSRFDSHGLCWMGGTVLVIAPHPVTRGLISEYWASLGRDLR